MIHYYIMFTRAKDSSAHGRLFRQWMQRLNQDGWNITISAKTDGLALRENVADAQYLLLLLETKDGKYYLSVVNPTYRKYIERQLLLVPTIVAHQWVVSHDVQYANWSKVRSLRGKHITKEEYLNVLRQKTSKI